MEKIVLVNNISNEVELKLIRDSSFITLKLTPKNFHSAYLRFLATLAMKEIIIEIIIEDGFVYQEEALHECCKKIDFDFFNEGDFLKVFKSLKQIAERKVSLRARAMVMINRIYWPRDESERIAAIENVCNFEIMFNKRHSVSEIRKTFSLNIREFLIKILEDRKVLEKEVARCFCRNYLKNNFYDDLFDENWIFLRNVFSMQKS